MTYRSLSHRCLKTARVSVCITPDNCHIVHNTVCTALIIIHPVTTAQMLSIAQITWDKFPVRILADMSDKCCAENGPMKFQLIAANVCHMVYYYNNRFMVPFPGLPG